MAFGRWLVVMKFTQRIQDPQRPRWRLLPTMDPMESSGSFLGLTMIKAYEKPQKSVRTLEETQESGLDLVGLSVFQSFSRNMNSFHGFERRKNGEIHHISEKYGLWGFPYSFHPPNFGSLTSSKSASTAVALNPPSCDVTTT